MTGFGGQTGIYELVEIDDTVSEMVIGGASDQQIRNYSAAHGYCPLFQAGMDKVVQGDVPLEELLRVTSLSEKSAAFVSGERITVNA